MRLLLRGGYGSGVPRSATMTVTCIDRSICNQGRNEYIRDRKSVV